MSSKLLMVFGGSKRFVPLDVPQAEADKLIEFYHAAGGATWATKTGWLTDPVVDNWHGVTVVGGHVTQLEKGMDLTVSGDIGEWGEDLATALPGLRYLYLYSTGVTGDVSGWTLPSTLQRLYLYSVTVSGDVSGWTLPAGLQQLLINSTSLSGDVSGWVLPATLTQFYANSTSLSGSMATWVIPAGMGYLRTFSSSLTGVPSFASAVSLVSMLVQNCNWDQPQVDAFLAELYARWAAGGLTYATPALNLGSNNAAPGGTYQDGDPPTTGKEYIYEMANDPETTGYPTWSITYNGGVAP